MRIPKPALALALCASACSPVIITNGKRQNPRPYLSQGMPNDVVLLYKYDTLPDQAIKLATTKVRIPHERYADSYDPLSDKLVMLEAKRLNGDLIRITNRSPFGNRLKADIYQVKNPLLPERGKYVIHLAGQSSLWQDRLYFNDSLLLTRPFVKGPIKTFTFDKGGILALAAGRFCKGIQLQMSGEFDIYYYHDSRHHRIHFLKIPIHADALTSPAMAAYQDKSENKQPTDAHCIVHLKRHVSRVDQGELCFNELSLISIPNAIPGQEYDFTFQTGGILAFRNPGSSEVSGFLLQKGQEYYIHLRVSAVFGPIFKVVDKDRF